MFKKQRHERLYAPFYKKSKEDKRWIRATFRSTQSQSDVEYRALPKEIAVRRYQSWLLTPFKDGINEIRELRPIKN